MLGLFIGFTAGSIYFAQLPPIKNRTQPTRPVRHAYSRLVDATTWLPTKTPKIVNTPTLIPQIPRPTRIPPTQGDVFVFNDIPTWWKICVNEASVRGGPETFYPILYTLSEETPVLVHELDNPTNTWLG